MFEINNIFWNVIYVNPNDDNLKRSDGSITLGVTDLDSKTIYINNRLDGALLQKVLLHEICHAFMFSYNIEIPIDQEEFLANWISVYGRSVIEILDMLLIQTNNSLNVL